MVRLIAENVDLFMIRVSIIIDNHDYAILMQL